MTYLKTNYFDPRYELVVILHFLKFATILDSTHLSKIIFFSFKTQ